MEQRWKFEFVKPCNVNSVTMETNNMYTLFYRYFFKTPSQEFGTDYVYEEIHDDSAVLPLIDGKIVAKVEKIEWHLFVFFETSNEV